MGRSTRPTPSGWRRASGSGAAATSARHASAARDLAELLRRASPDVAAANAHVVEAITAETRAMLDAVVSAGRADARDMAAAARGDNLAVQFERLWRACQGPELEREYRFHPVRKWRLDYYHAATRTGIELEGGLYSGGRHTRAAGYQGDIDKYNAAAMQGITVLRLGTGQIDQQHVMEIISYINAKLVYLAQNKGEGE